MKARTAVVCCMALAAFAALAGDHGGMHVWGAATVICAVMAGWERI